MEGKKKYIALILFLFIGLMVFTFANPREDEELDDKKGNVSDVVKDDTKSDVDNSNQQVSNNDETSNVQSAVVRRAINAQNVVADVVGNQNPNEGESVVIESENYNAALKAVEKAEESLLLNDHSTAQDLVNNLTDSKEKEQLVSRLDEVLNGINASELVTNLEKMVNEAASLKNMADARNYNVSNDIFNVVSKLKNEKLKEDLTNRLNNLNGLLSDEDSPVITGINDGDVVNTLANVLVEDANTYTVTLNGEEYVLGTELTKDGQYELVIVDAAFNETKIKFTYDTTAPVLSLKSDSVGTDGVYSKINFKLSDNIGLAKVIVNGKEYKRTGKWNDLNFQNVNNYVEGENTVVLVDKAGNETEIKFIYDKTAPKVEKVQIYNKNNVSSSYIKNGQTIRVITSFNEELSNVPTIKIGNYEKEFVLSDDGKGNAIYVVDVTIASDESLLPEGILSYTISGYKDKAGNEGEVFDQTKSKMQLTYDRTAPVISVKSDSVGTDNVYSKISFKLSDNIDLAKVIVNGKEYKRTGKWNDLNFQNVNNYVEGENTVVLVDKAGNETEIKFTLDKTAPTASLSMRTTEPTNKNLIVTLKANEAIKVPKGWTKVSDTTYTKKYTRNTTEKIEIEDLAGNKSLVEISITNIDKTIPTAVIKFSNDDGNSMTNQDVTVTLIASEAIKTPEGWDKIDDVTYTRVYSENAKDSVIITDIAGNTVELKYEVKRIDKVAPTGNFTFSNDNGNSMTNQDVTVTLTTNESILTPEGWTRVKDKVYTKVYSENAKDSVTITDKAGNTTELKYEVKRIDKVAPEGTITTSNNNGATPTNQDVTVTLTTNESILTPEGWTRVKDKVYTKVYSENAKDSVTITDKAGNTTELKYEVKRIDKVAPKLTVVDPNKYYVEAGSAYVDKGYSAYDDVDKDVTKLVEISYLFQAKGSNEWKSVNSLDTTKLGTYKVTYTAYDKAGNTNKATRVVAIQDTVSPIFTSLMNGHKYDEVVIDVEDVTLDTITVYSYSNNSTTLVPNGTELTELGTYRIIAKDKAGNETKIYVTLQ